MQKALRFPFQHPECWLSVRQGLRTEVELPLPQNRDYTPLGCVPATTKCLHGLVPVRSCDTPDTISAWNHVIRSSAVGERASKKPHLQPTERSQHAAPAGPSALLEPARMRTRAQGTIDTSTVVALRNASVHDHDHEVTELEREAREECHRLPLVAGRDVRRQRQGRDLAGSPVPRLGADRARCQTTGGEGPQGPSEGVEMTETALAAKPRRSKKPRTSKVFALDVTDPLFKEFQDDVAMKTLGCHHARQGNFLCSCCWMWGSSITPQGYGVYHIPRRFRSLFPPGTESLSANKAAYIAFVSPIAGKDIDVDHLCHKDDGSCDPKTCTHRSCVRPNHLSPLDWISNRRQTARKKRVLCPAGDHVMTAANTGRTPRGASYCKDCRAMKALQRQEARDERARAKAGTRAARGAA